MGKDTFLKLKIELSNKIRELINAPEITAKNKDSLTILLSIINEYKYENRLESKGWLSHSVVDIFNNDFTIGDDLIEFKAYVENKK